MIYYVIILLVIGLDQLTKLLIRQNFEPGQSLPLIEDVLHLTYVQNQGAAFSILEGKPLFFIVINAIVVAVILVYIALRRRTLHPLALTALALVAGGGAGNNLIDRVRFGYVVDFIDFQIWPVFNVADIGVVVGVGLLFIYVIIIESRRAKKIDK
ncbi:MAG TPA: signal peptidase II [Clostridiales bacterium]|jgi:signal peptidase II|nr:signal peptidase II [Clostridiales bacterium]